MGLFLILEHREAPQRHILQLLNVPAFPLTFLPIFSILYFPVPIYCSFLGAAAITLTDNDLSEIEKVVPKDSAAGGRYPESQLSGLDSERKSGS